jgi:putative DNA primase/helicase
VLVESRLRESGCLPGSKGMFQCPAHEDRNPSLSVREGAGGKVLLKCHAGCASEAIVAALGLTWGDLFPPKERTPARVGDADYGRQLETASFPIKDQDGKLIATHEREDFEHGKKFLWYDSRGNLGLGGLSVKELPLYGTQYIVGFDRTRPVFLCEGEKDTDRLWTLKVPALGTVTGAGTEPGRAPLAVLAGLHVVLWPDADASGRRHMDRIGVALAGVAASVRVFAPEGLPVGGGAFDWIAEKQTAGMSPAAMTAELEALGRAAPEWVAPAAEPATTQAVATPPPAADFAPLRRPPTEATPFPELPGLLGKAVVARYNRKLWTGR